MLTSVVGIFRAKEIVSRLREHAMDWVLLTLSSNRLLSSHIDLSDLSIWQSICDILVHHICHEVICFSQSGQFNVVLTLNTPIAAKSSAFFVC